MSANSERPPFLAGTRMPRSSRIAELLGVAFVMALLTLFIGDLPELEVVESTVNDDSFSDLLVTTRGELPIDTSIIVLTFGPEFLDEAQRIDRGLLAQGIAYTFAFEPAVVGVDFLIDDVRDDKPENDAMLAGVIGDYHERLIFGLYSIDSLGTAPAPPALFGLRDENLGSVNLREGEDRVIRTFRPDWPGVDGKPMPLLSVRVAEHLDPEAVAHLRSFDADELVIDYAAGIGEHEFRAEGEAGLHVFPSLPLEVVAEALMSETSDDDEAMRELISGRAVLIGYADLRDGQVRSVVDRFYTPLKPEANARPDMHGVAIHANILNTILQRRIVTKVPVGVDLLWGTLIVFFMFLGHEFFIGLRPERKRAIVRYGGWAILLAVALFLPILLFRTTSWKLSVYTPFAGLLLGRFVLATFDRLKRFVRDARRRNRIRSVVAPSAREHFLHPLATSDPNERYLAALHLLQRIFHTSVDRVLRATSEGDLFLSTETVASPTPYRILEDVDTIGADLFPLAVRSDIDRIRKIDESTTAQKALRTARSLVIAVNEIDRQQKVLEEQERARYGDDVELYGEDPYETSQADAVLVAASGADAATFAGSDLLLDELIAIAVGAGNNGTSALLPQPEEVEGDLPFVLQTTCTVHGVEEMFVYLSEQEDANNRDDYHDLVYAGETIRCRPQSHPGLTRFRELSSDATTDP